MILVWFDIENENYYSYLARYGHSLDLGDSNKFGSILVGIIDIDYLDKKLIPYHSSWTAEFNTISKYDKRIKE